MHCASQKSLKLQKIGARDPFGKEPTTPVGHHALLFRSPVHKECWGNALVFERPEDYVQVTREKLRRRGRLHRNGCHTMVHCTTRVPDFVDKRPALERFSLA